MKEDDLPEGMNALVQLGKRADASSIQVGCIVARVQQLKRYPAKCFNKKTNLFTQMDVMLQEIGDRAVKIYDKLYSVYYDELREKYPELEVAKAKPKLRKEDGTEYDITSGKRGRRKRRSTSEPKPKKQKFNLADKFG